MEQCSAKHEARGQPNPDPGGHAARLPPAPRLLYGLSPLVVPRPGYWPPAVQLCGFWQPRPGLLDAPGAALKICKKSEGPAAGSSLQAASADDGQAAHGSGEACSDVGPGMVAEPLLQWRRELLPLWPLVASITQNAVQPADRPCSEANSAVHAAVASRLGVWHKPVCFDFGSMAALGLLGDAARVAAAMRTALEALGMCGVLLTGAPRLGC